MADGERLLAATRRELARFPAVLRLMVGALDEASARTRPAPAEWAPIEIVCHLRDEETEDFGARLRVVVEGGREFAPIDPEGWAERRRYRDEGLGEALTRFEERRAASLAFLSALAPERLVASVPHRRLGELSGLDLLAAWVTHDRLHHRQLAGVLARLWSMEWAPLRCQYAGPIPYGPDEQA